MAQSKEVAEKKNSALALDLSVLEGDAGGGMENITQDDLALPFLKVLSGNDEVCYRDESTRKGDIYNTVYKLYLVLTNVDLSNGRQGEQVAMHLLLFILQRRQDQKQNDLLKTIKNTLSMAMVST